MSNNNPFMFDLPKGWMDQTVYVFQGPKEADLDHGLMLTLDRKWRFNDIADFAAEKTLPIIETMDNIDILKNEEITLPNGNSAWEFVYKSVPADGMIFFYKYVFVYKDKIGFTFSGKFTKQTIKTIGAQMKQIIENLLPGTYEPPDED
ncbi:MAG: hypothetical protein DRP51_03905 [Candidatus Zixiibacteriota bacterium]|nr:MAG: hypothetical protein DRP51_03905 [candidate division Zixibacteria bacterium]